MKRSLSVFVLFLLLSSFCLMFLEIPAVKASYILNDATYVADVTDTASHSYAWDPSCHAAYQMSDDTLFIPVGLTSGSTQSVYWWYSDDDGLSWGAASTAMAVIAGSSKSFEAFAWDGVYDPTTGNFHASSCYDSASGTDYLYYYHGARSGNSISNTRSTLFNNNYWYGGTSAITVDENGFPIVAYNFRNYTATPTGTISVSVFFGEDTTSTPSFHSFTITMLSLLGWENTNLQMDLHVVDENNVLLLMADPSNAFQVYGVYVHRTSGFGSAFAVSQDSTTEDVIDSNSVLFGVMASYSEHTEDPREYAEEIMIVYVNNAEEVKGELYEVDIGSGLDLLEEEVIEDCSVYSSPDGVGRIALTKDEGQYWAIYIHARDDLLAFRYCNLSIAEYQVNGSWDVDADFIKVRDDANYDFLISNNMFTLNSTLTGIGILTDDHDGSPISYQDFYFYEAAGEVPPLAFDLNVYGENFNSAGGDPDFVFVDWRYYDFNFSLPDSQLNTTGLLDTLYLRFTLPTYEGNIVVAPYYNSVNDTWGYVYSSDEPENRAGSPILIQAGSTETFNVTGLTGTNYIFSIWFQDKCVDVYDPDDCIRVEWAWNETDGYSESWHGENDVFRVYNDGGFPDDVVITGSPYAGVLPGGRDISMFGYNDTYVLKEVVWRDAVHIKFMPTVNFRAGEGIFNQYYALNYVLEDGTQLPGIQIKIEPDVVAYTGVFASNVWINMTVSFYSNNTFLKSDYLYMFYHGTVATAMDPGRWKFWIDLWFDEQNASSVQGARINAYEYPMEDNSAVWLRWLSSNWGVKDNVSKQAECFAPLLDSDYNVVSAEKVKFVVLQAVLDVPGIDSSDQYVALTDFGVYDVSFSRELPMRGISSPPWDETQMPVVGNTGVLGAVWSMFQGIGQWLSENILFGGLNLWGNFVAFLDTIAGWLGAPGFFTWLFSEIGNAFTYLINSAGYAWEVLSSIFILTGSLLSVFVTTVADLIGSFVSFLSNFVDFMGGGLGAAANLWDTLGIASWIQLGMILYPLYLLILWEEKGMGAVIEQLTWIFGLLVWLFHFFEGLVMGAVQLISSLIESIPVAE